MHAGSGLPRTGSTIAMSSFAADPQADPPIREIVTITAADLFFDPLFNIQTTKLSWDASEALRYEHHLPRTVVRGNVVPATHGERRRERFMTSEEWDLRPPLL